MKFTSLVLLAAPVASLVPATSTSGRTATQLYGYVPDGLSAAEYAASGMSTGGATVVAPARVPEGAARCSVCACVQRGE